MANGVGRLREEFQISRSRILMRNGRTRLHELHEQLRSPNRAVMVWMMAIDCACKFNV
jgi:hypothetical protein